MITNEKRGQVSEEVREAAGDADLVILEGMGRGLETNLHARFSVDSLKLGMIKHKEVRLVVLCVVGVSLKCAFNSGDAWPRLPDHILTVEPQVRCAGCADAGRAPV